jgi:DNA-binding PadR family transcriptional regulator
VKIPAYILGFLRRYGPLHGYKLKGLLSDMVSDFTSIKLPTIYYHLEKMEQKGFIAAQREQEGNRPERSVYTITPEGESVFNSMLLASLKEKYRPEFDIDTSLYFMDSVDMKDLKKSLNTHIINCQETLSYLEKHREKVLSFIPEEAHSSARALFSHHELHYKAELQWLKETLENLDISRPTP